MLTMAIPGVEIWAVHLFTYTHTYKKSATHTMSVSWRNRRLVRTVRFYVFARWHRRLMARSQFTLDDDDDDDDERIYSNVA